MKWQIQLPPLVQPLCRHLPHAVSWNQWQTLLLRASRICSDTFDFEVSTYKTIMASRWGATSWKHAIAELTEAQMQEITQACFGPISYPQRLRHTVESLPHPISWNQWQQLPGVTSTYTEFLAAMQSRFGFLWQQSIQPLPKHSFTPSSSQNLTTWQPILQCLPHPISWNDWQRCLSKAALSSTFQEYDNSMQQTFGDSWSKHIQNLSAQDFATVRPRAVQLPRAPPARKLRLRTVIRLLSTVEDLFHSLTSTSRFTATEHRLATRIRRHVGNAKRALSRRRLSRNMHEHSLANLQPFASKRS